MSRTNQRYALFYSAQQAEKTGVITVKTKDGNTYQYTDSVKINVDKDSEAIKPDGSWTDYKLVGTIPTTGNTYDISKNHPSVSSHFGAPILRSLFNKTRKNRRIVLANIKRKPQLIIDRPKF